MAKSMSVDFIQFALMHEARHLLQEKQGRHEAEEKNLDYASYLMINRATEADAEKPVKAFLSAWFSSRRREFVKILPKSLTKIKNRRIILFI